MQHHLPSYAIALPCSGGGIRGANPIQSLGTRHGIGQANTTPARALKSAGVRPSKSRGQNFLVQPSIATQIVSAAEIEAGDSVVEIGPGLGILTERILDAGPGKLTLVELDARLAAMLAA